MRSSILFTIISLSLLCSCSNQKQSTINNPYAELGDTVPASVFAPSTKDSLAADTAMSDSIPSIQSVQTPSKQAPAKSASTVKPTPKKNPTAPSKPAAPSKN